MTMLFQNHVKKVSRMFGMRAECRFHCCFLRLRGDAAVILWEGKDGICLCDTSALENSDTALSIAAMLAEKFDVVMNRDRRVTRFDRVGRD